MNIPREYKLSTRVAGRFKVAFDERVMKMFEEQASRIHSSYSKHPWIGMLGSKDGVVRRIIKCYGEGGCWNMPNLSVEQMTDTAIKLAVRGYNLAGIVRVGKFEVGIVDGSRGHQLEELGQFNPKFFTVSVGLDGMQIDSYYPARDGNKYVKHGWYTLPANQEVGYGNTVTSSDSESGSEEGDVRQVIGADQLQRVHEGHDSVRVSQSSADQLRFGSSRQQEGSSTGLPPAGRGHHNPGNEGVRRSLTPEQRRARSLALAANRARREREADIAFTQRELAIARAERERQQASRRARTTIAVDTESVPANPFGVSDANRMVLRQIVENPGVEIPEHVFQMYRHYVNEEAVSE